MPRKRIPRAVFNAIPEYSHCTVVKGWPYWFMQTTRDPHENKITFDWLTLCSRCRSPFIEQSEFKIFWLHKRCPRHRRKQPSLDDKIVQAARTLKKFHKYHKNLSP